MSNLKLFIPCLRRLKKAFVFLLLVLTQFNSFGQKRSFNDSVIQLADIRAPDQVITNTRIAQLHFKKAPNSRIDIGLVGNNYHYFLLKLNSTDTVAHEKFLVIDNTSLDTVSIFRINAGTLATTLIYQGGNRIPFNTNRNYAWHTASVNISNAPSFYLVAIKAAYKNLNLRYDILTGNALQKKYTLYQRYVFFYIGIVSMIAIIMLIAFLLFRKAVFAAYLGYTICAGGWILTHYGCVFPMVYPQWPVINEIIKPVTSLGASFFLMLVLLLVFQNSLRQKRWIRQVLMAAVYSVFILVGLVSCLLIPNLAGNIQAILIGLWQIALLFSIVIIVLTPISLLKIGYTAKIFAVAALVICLMTIIQQIANLGYIQSFFINEHGITMASLLEITIMAFGLFYGFYQEKKQKEKQVIELEQERTETLKKLITVQDNERKRIASDLHDNLGPLLAALKINFRRIISSKDSIQENLAEKTEAIIDDSIAEIRNVAHNLMPKGLSSNGLINTLNEYFDSIQQLYNKGLLFNHQIESPLSTELQTNLYRIICELVLNAARHSKGERINVLIKTKKEVITLNIYDDGQGFIQNHGGEKKTLGLQSAESRVVYMKGAFNLKTEKDKGTMIQIEIPLQFNQAHVGSF